MREIELTVIINSFNRLDLLKGSLTSLCDALNKASIGYAVVIFDANSNDGSPEWVNNFIRERGVENIFLIKPDSDQVDSFSSGVNTASSFAIQKFENLKFLFFYETDNFITSHQPLIDARKIIEDHMNIAACGFTVKKHDGRDAGFASAFPGLSSLMLGQQMSFKFGLNKPNLNWVKKINIEFSYADVVYTSPLLIQKSVWVNLNGLDAENFPFSDCDIDLAYRIHKLGLRMAVLKSDAVIHDNLENLSVWSAKRTSNFYRARFAYFKKHFGYWINFLKPVLFIMHLSETFVLFILLIMKKSSMKSVKVRLGLLRGVFFNYR